MPAVPCGWFQKEAKAMKVIGAELMISVIHLAGPPVRVGGFMTQRCLLCGRVIVHLDLERFAEVIETEEGEQFRIMVAVPNSLVRVTDRPRLFGPSDRTIELVRRIQNTADAFAGPWELPPGTCVLEGRSSVALQGGPLDSGYYHVERGQPVPDVFAVDAGARSHVYRHKGGGVAVYVTTEQRG